MKILVIGEKHPWSNETSCARIFGELGCEVFHWDNKSPSLLFGNRSWWKLSRPERVAYDAMASLQFYKACAQFRPDVIYMSKAENIHSHAVCRALEKTNARLVVWYPDHPFRSDQTSMNVLRNLKRCHRFYIWGHFLVEPLLAAGCQHAEHLPFGFDPVQHPPDLVLSEEERRRFASDICFVGTWTLEREQIISTLAGLNLAIWGPLWNERVSSSSPLRPHFRGDGLYGQDMVRGFKSARIVLNLLQPHNGSAHNVRTMEATGIGGGALLVRRTPEQAEELFKEGEHLFCFGSPAELRGIASDLLKDSVLLGRVSEKARKHVEGNHQLRFRIQKIVSSLKS